MDNNGNFEQQFTQNVKSAATQPVYETKLESASSGSKLPLVIAIALAAITLVESIALVITLSNYFSIINEGTAEYDTTADGETIDDSYTYDNDYNLTAFKLICTAEDGSYYNFTNDNKFEQHNTTGAISASGSYTIANDSLVSLSGNNKVLYYDGYDVADGLTLYTCEETVTEANTNDSETE